MKTQKLAAIVLAVMMLLSMAACTSNSAAPVGTVTPTTTDSNSATPAQAEKVTFTAFIVQQPNGMTDITTNTFTKWLEEKTNVHLDMTVVQNDGSKDKLTLMLASDDYPELILTGSNSFTNADLVNYGTKEKILIPLNDLIEKNADNLKQIWTENPQLKDQMTALDGNIYGIPSLDSGGTSHGNVGVKLWMNLDWLKNLGLSMPVTTEDFKNVLTAFKTRDPNGNGKADEIPMTGAINTWCGDPYIFLLNAFDYYDPYMPIKLKDGKISLCADTDGFKEGLKYIKDLCDNDLIDPAAFTQNEQQMAAVGNNKDAVIGGAATCGHLAMFIDTSNLELSKQYGNILPLQGSNGYRGIPYATKPSVSGASFAITDKCKNPEAAIKWADVFCSEEGVLLGSVGVQGKQWDVADPGTFGMDGKTPAKYKYLSAYTTASGASDVNDAWGWALKLIQPDVKSLFQVEGDIYDPANYEARLWRETIKLLPYAAEVDQLPPFWLSEEDSVKMSTLQTPLQDYIKTSIVEFITGKKNIDKDWDAYIAGLNKLGAQEYITLYQTAYDSLKK